LSLEYILALIIGISIMFGAPAIGKIIWPFVENCIVEDKPVG
jgi:type IV secretory pathway VirB2 component (pilin)